LSLSQRDQILHGDLRRLTTLISVAIAFFGLLLLAIIAYAGWSSNQTAVDRERTLLDNAFNESILRVLNEQKSIAWWDDPVVKITDEEIDLEFTDANFGVFLTETYGQDEVYILNAKDQPLYAWAEAERRQPSAFEARHAALGPLIDEIRTGDTSRLRARPDMFYETKNRYDVLIGVQVARWAGHIVSVDGRPAVVAGMTIVPNIDMSLLQGTPNLLLSITYIDEEFISQIGRSLLLPDLTLLAAPSRGSAIISEPFITDDGVQAGYLSWTSRQPGQVLLTAILPLVALGVLLTGFLSRTMFRRLRRASEALAQREFEARHEAKHDSLSGLPNRVHMVERIEKFLNSYIARRNGQRALAAYVDIDRFKDVNDTLGHEAGDELIKLVAHRLATRLRPNDFLARFGGDEFVLLCAPAGLEAGESLIGRITQAFEAPFAVKGQTINVTASIGLAVAPENGSTADELMRHADIALYEAKNQGRDRAVYFSTKMAEEVEHRRSIELDLRAAMEHQEFDLHYQPVISCSTGKVVGVEALLRWHHPLYGSMPPAEFIPVAENAGLLPAIGEWVLERAMTDAKLWPELEIAVNLSPVQFRHVDLESMLRRLIVKHAVDPGRFVLEITEGVLLEATDRVNTVLDAIRDMGFRTALDDFGTGYSSLSYLCNFQFDKIKIDRSFISSISRVDTTKTIIKSVVTLGRGLGMDIVAEGIETPYEASMMTRFGCTELQGFYFARPLPVEEMVKFLETYEPRNPDQEPGSLQQPIAGDGLAG
jgi:diguanylate cyclase (GGDEF)-like protein